MLYPLRFIPIYMERIWGGTGLREEFGRKLPGAKIGESWEVTCRADAMSIVAEGPWQGRRLADLIVEYQTDLLGTEISVDRSFPLLLKILDAQDLLSVQVHPDDEYARVHEDSLGKEEVWYILKASLGAKIIYGLKQGVTRKDLLRALDAGKIGDCLNEVEVKAGEVYPISAGMAHALGSGIMVVELQQNSDLTYRLYDWDRRDDQGRSRPLHIEKALETLSFDAQPSPKACLDLEAREKILAENTHFTLSYLRVSGEERRATNDQAFDLLIVVDGDGGIKCGQEEYPAHYGDSFLLPAGLGEYSLYGQLTLLMGRARPCVNGL